MATHEYLVIDCDTRKVDIPTAEKVFGVYLDANAERKYFSCERYVGDDVDLSECSISINFQSVSGEKYTYECDDVALSADDEDTVVFSWLLTREVFDSNKDGSVSFTVQAVDSSGVAVFNTRLAQGKVYESIGEPANTVATVISVLATTTFEIDDDGDLIMTVEDDDSGVSAEVTDEYAEGTHLIKDGDLVVVGSDGTTSTITLVEGLTLHDASELLGEEDAEDDEKTAEEIPD